MKSGPLLALGLASLIVGATAACSGGPAPVDLTFGSGYDNPSNTPSTGATDAVGTTKKPASGESSGKPTTTATATATPDPAPRPAASNCPVCGTYSCSSGSSGTADVTLANAAANGCSTGAASAPVTLQCGSTIVDSSGKTVGAWAASGSTLVVSITGSSPETCTPKK